MNCCTIRPTEEPLSPQKSLLSDFWYEGEHVVLFGEKNIAQFATQIAKSIDSEVFLVEGRSIRLFKCFMERGIVHRQETTIEIPVEKSVNAYLQLYLRGKKDDNITIILNEAMGRLEDEGLLFRVFSLKKEISFSFLLVVNEAMDYYYDGRYFDTILFAKKEDNQQIAVEIKKTRRHCFMKRAVYSLDFPK